MKSDNEDYEFDQTLGLTSQGAVEAVGNRYDLILIAARRVRELHRGDARKVYCRRGSTLTALKEIELGKVGRDYLLREQDLGDKKPRKNRNTF